MVILFVGAGTGKLTKSNIMEITNIPKVWFTADTHFHHAGLILKHHPQRAEIGGFDNTDINSHDKWLMDLWNSTIGKKDTVYIIGDFSFANRDATVRLLHNLKGEKHLILGNHDKSSEKLTNMFKTIYQIRNVVFKKSVYPYLEEDFNVNMCHYAQVTWNMKPHGAVHIHGHSHGKLDDYNTRSKELRVDVGFDGKLANHGFIELQDLYNYFKGISQEMSFKDYTLSLREALNNESPLL
jgi:calcineurin-like phosphoesterase family protein